MSQKTALVTGGSTGIGRAIAKDLAEDGFAVVITGRDEATLKESAAQHEAISYVAADVTSQADIDRTISEVESRHGRLDLLVNNAGIAPLLPLEHVTEEHVESVFDVNVKGLVLTTLKSLPLLKASRGGIVNISSALADRPFPGASIYSATKGAVNTLSKAWAKELAPDGIRVNIVSPGPIETPIYGKMNMPDEDAQAMAQQITTMVPLARFGQSEEVAKVVSFLGSDKASYVTGSQYHVDGGMGA